MSYLRFFADASGLWTPGAHRQELEQRAAGRVQQLLRPGSAFGPDAPQLLLEDFAGAGAYACAPNDAMARSCAPMRRHSLAAC